MKITQFDRISARQIVPEITAAMEAVASKYGLAVKYTGGSFSGTTFQPKFEFAVVAGNGQALTREVEDFKRCAEFFGMDASDLGKDFTHNGEIFTVCGIKPSSPKFPILAKKKFNGKVFKFQAASIKSKLHNAA